MKYVCDICGYVYDPAAGDPDNGVAPGTPWEAVPEDWVCPLCGVGLEGVVLDLRHFLLVFQYRTERERRHAQKGINHRLRRPGWGLGRFRRKGGILISMDTA